MKRAVDDIDLIVIHCAATPNGRSRYTIEDIDSWHHDRGFRRRVSGNPKHMHVGYHYVIHVDGTVALGRGIEEVGAHARGVNENSVGVCMIGTDAFTREQWESLRVTVSAVEQLLLSNVRVTGHNEFSTKTCPGFDAQAWRYDRCGLPLETDICESRH